MSMNPPLNPTQTTPMECLWRITIKMAQAIIHMAISPMNKGHIPISATKKGTRGFLGPMNMLNKSLLTILKTLV